MTIRGPCPKCRSSDAFITWKDGNQYCFSCHYKPKSEWTMEKIKSSFTVGKNNSPTGIELPSDFSVNIPPGKAAEWLSQYRLTPEEINKNKIGYSDEEHSLIFPVFSGAPDHSLVMYQKRYFGINQEVPKYISVGHKHDVIHLPKPHIHDTIVLVEDIVSAIRVSRITNCMPLFGSHLSLPTALKLGKRYRKARVWLDSNKKATAVRIALVLNEIGVRTTIIFTDKDPKEYTTADIQRLIGLNEEDQE